MRRRARLPLLAAATWALRAAGHTGPEELMLASGACDALAFLNGLLFREEGHTASGAPYYKALGRSEYLYWDPNCFNGDTGTPRWILDRDKPSLNVSADLDQDGGCNYHSRIDSSNWKHPPDIGMWHMMCMGQWRNQVLVFTHLTTTVTATRTSTTTRLVTSTATTATTTGSTLTTTSTATSTVSTTFTTTTVSATTTVSTTTVPTSTTTTTEVATTSATSTSATATSVATTSATSTSATATSVLTTSATATSTGTTATATSVTSSATTETATTTHAVPATTTHTTATDTQTTATNTTGSTTTMTSATGTTANVTDALAAADATTTTTTTFAEAVETTPAQTTPALATPVHTTSSAACCSCCPADDGGRVCCGGLPGRGQPPCCEDTSGTATSTVVVATSSTTTTGGTSTSPAGAANVTGLPQALLLSGLCPDKDALNGLLFSLQGRAAGGAPFYASRWGYYLYYDPDCRGSGDRAPRWVLDTDAPDTGRPADLDGDRECRYLARLTSPDAGRPPSSAVWRVFCGGAWQDLTLLLAETNGTESPRATPPATTAPVTATMPPQGRPSEALDLQGACELQKSLNGPFLLQGTTASGHPYYKAVAGRRYLYFDHDCDGGLAGIPRWIIDSDEPNVSRTRDLDGDQDCVYLARINSRSPRPPAAASWLMDCRSGWKELPLVLREISASSIVPASTSVSPAGGLISGGSSRLCTALPLLSTALSAFVAAVPRVAW